MTLHAAKKHVAALGYRLRYSPEYREYTVIDPNNRAADYFTPDRDDAIGTAEAMFRARLTPVVIVNPLDTLEIK